MKTTVIAFGLCALFLASAASAQCTTSERRQMRDAGFSATRIARLCDDDDEEELPRSRSTRSQQGGSRSLPPSNICQTPAMWCTLFQSGPVGSPCWCNTPFGPSNGSLIPR